MRALSLVLMFLLAIPAQGQTPALTVSHRARALQPGEVVQLRIVSSVALASARVSGVGREVPAVRLMSAGDAGDVWQALLGIDVEVAPGATTLRVEATTTTGTVLATDYAVTIEPKAFRARRLSVEPRYVSPPPAVRARIAREAARLNAIYKTTTSEFLCTPPFAPPVRHRMNSPFGAQSIYNGEVRGRHLGVDFASPAGSKIGAPAPGRVVLTDDLYYTGQTVVIDHGQGVHTIFAHLSRISVRDGARVTTGDVVGTVGSTGRSSGPHLHWSVRVAGARVDPLSLVEVE